MNGFLPLAVAVALSGLATAQESAERTASLDERFARLRELPEDQAELRVELAKEALALAVDPPDLGAELEASFHIGMGLFDLERYAESCESLDRAAQLARFAESAPWLLQILGNLAIVKNLLGELDRAFESAEEFLALAREHGRPGYAAKALNVLATVHERRGDFASAIEAYGEALGLVLEHGGRLEAAVILNNIGVAHVSLGHETEAIEFFDGAAGVLREVGDDAGLAGALANIADIDRRSGDLEEALARHLEALELREACCPPGIVALSHQSVGITYHELGRNEAALEHLEQALEIQQRLGLAAETVATLSGMARVYAAQDRDGEALETATLGLKLASAGELRGQRLAVLESLAAAHESAGSPTEALTVLREAAEIERAMRSLDVQEALAEFRAKLETDLKQREIEALEKDNELRRIQRNALAIGGALLSFIAAIGWTLFVYRRRAHRRELERELRYQALCDLSPVGIFRADGNGRVHYASSRFCDIADTPESAVIGREWFDLIEAEDREVAREAWRKCVGGETPFAAEFRIRRPDGTVRHVLGQAAAEKDGDLRSAGFVGTITDVTIQHDLEEGIRQTQKLGSLGLLAGGIAHDFNNLMTAILGHGNMAQKSLSHDEDARTHLENIDRAAEQAGELCRQLLAYAGRGSFTLELLDLNRVVQDTCELFELAISKKAKLELVLGNPRPVVLGDVTQVRQVLLNLVGNASDAQGDRAGRIGVYTGTVERAEGTFYQSFLADEDLIGGYAMLAVTDEGSGMDDATLEKVFDPFFTTKKTGHGLGMAGVLGIVRSHRGAIRVETTVGRGTRVEVLLPASSSDTTRRVDDVGPLVDTERHRGALVLVVEDEPALLQVAAQSLEAEGFAVLAARDGEQALAVFEANAGRVDLVLLDIVMPVMDGAEVYAALRDRGHEVPILCTSGYTKEETRERLLSYGSPRFLKKPYRPGTLVRAVCECLAESKARTAALQRG